MHSPILDLTCMTEFLCTKGRILWTNVCRHFDVLKKFFLLYENSNFVGLIFVDKDTK